MPMFAPLSDFRGGHWRVFTPTRHGITLMELLVVMAILSILVTLSAGGVFSVREKARGLECSSQLRQMAMAAEMYRQDNHGRLFPYLDTGSHGSSGNRRYWFGQSGQGAESFRRFDPESGYLHAYLGAGRIRLCPSFPYGKSFVKLKYDGVSFGYGYNIHVASGNLDTGSPHILRPAGTVLFADAGQINNFQAPASPENPLFEEFYLIGRFQRTVHFRHTLRSGAVFCDGHVDWLALTHAGKKQEKLFNQVVGELPGHFLSH